MNVNPYKLNRRLFLSGAAAAMGSSLILPERFVPTANAADTSGYKALVCIFLFGGMDQADTVLPFDQINYDRLVGIRPGLFEAYGAGSGNTSRDRENLLEISPQNAADFPGQRFALPPEMTEMRDMFAESDMAIIGNVGPLLEPTDRDGFENNTANLPKRLFSHNDQQSTWMSFGVEGTQYGWGGRFADAVASGGSNPLYTSIGLSGNDVFLSGEDIRPFLTSPSGFGRGVNVVDLKWISGYGDGFDAMRVKADEFYKRNDFGHNNLLKMDFGNMSAQGIENVRTFGRALESGSNYEGQFPDTNIGSQLRTIAETISARGPLAVNRQIFYASIGGFDTHSDQASTLPNRQARLSKALDAFRTVMQAEGLWNDVTLFTASDFGRTTIDNGDGTDHGWGGHQFVMGGSVNGGRIFGSVPAPDLDLPEYTQEGGRLIPTVSVDQYAGALGSWFGLTQNELGNILPNYNNFGGISPAFV